MEIQGDLTQTEEEKGSVTVAPEIRVMWLQAREYCSHQKVEAARNRFCPSGYGAGPALLTTWLWPSSTDCRLLDCGELWKSEGVLFLITKFVAAVIGTEYWGMPHLVKKTTVKTNNYGAKSTWVYVGKTVGVHDWGTNPGRSSSIKLFMGSELRPAWSQKIRIFPARKRVQRFKNEKSVVSFRIQTVFWNVYLISGNIKS